MASLRNGDQLVWYPNDGTGRFGAKQEIGELQSVIAFDIKDIDSDGDLDVIATEYRSNERTSSVEWFENLRDGQFVQKRLADDGIGLMVVDVDADLDLDLLVNGRWVENLGDGRFADLRNLVRSDVLAAADFDNDGDIDLVGSYNYFENQGDETFEEHSLSWETVLFEPYEVIPFDADGDGDLDLFTRHSIGAAASTTLHCTRIIRTALSRSTSALMTIATDQ